jgi:hypothetical protein
MSELKIIGIDATTGQSREAKSTDTLINTDGSVAAVDQTQAVLSAQVFG